MDEHELFAQLKSEIARDLTPVQPLRAPAARAWWLMGLWITMGSLVVVVSGPRPDIAVLGPWRSLGLSLVQLGLCLALFRASLRFSIPAMAAPLPSVTALAVGAAAVHLFVNWATVAVSDLAPPAGREWSTGVACLSAITVLSLPPMILGVVMLSRGVLTRLLPALLLTGLACGLAAEATWRLHCPYSEWSHILPSHSGALVLILALASAAATVVRRKARPGLGRA